MKRKTRKRRKRAKTVITPNPRPRVLFRFSLLGILLVLVLLPGFSSENVLRAAQKSKDKPYALIAGTVWGPDDRPIYGVTVKIRRAKDKKPKWEVYSDHRGEFAQRVPPGESDYILSADLKHFKPADGQPLHQAQEVTVHIYGEEREDTGLHLTH
jgi:hypothetical protein